MKEKDLRDLYEQTIGYITVVCSRYVSDKEDLKDILHDVYLKAFGALDNFEDKGPGSLRAWISRIAVNECISHLRKNRKLIFFNEGLPIPDESDDDTPDIDGIDVEDILGAIQELPPGFRTVLNLFLFEEKSHKEIASMLGISESTSASQYHRAKAMLARILKNKNNEHRLDR